MKQSKAIDYLLGHVNLDDIGNEKYRKIIKPKHQLDLNSRHFVPVTFLGEQYFVSIEEISTEELNKLVDTDQCSVWSIYNEIE